MNGVLTEMLKKYQAESIADKKNAVKEVMQELVFFLTMEILQYLII